MEIRTPNKLRHPIIPIGKAGELKIGCPGFATDYTVALKTPLQEHLKRVKAIHEQDLADGWGCMLLPDAPDRKYPNAPKD